MEIMGKEFRVVNNGLDPEEVIEFLKTATGSSDDAFQRLEQFSALQTVAKTMEESIAQAKRLAENAKKQALEEARQEKDRTIREAREQARVMIDGARKSCTALIDDVRSVLSTSIDKAFEQARETISNNLKDLDVNVPKASASQKSPADVVNEKVDAEPSVSSTDSSDDTNTDDEEEGESDDDSALDLADLQRSLMDLESSLTSLHDSRNGAESESEPQPTSQSPDRDTESKDESPDTEVTDDEPDNENSHQYSGEVVVEIPAGADEAWMQELRQRAHELPGVHIRAESGMNDKTTAVTLSLEEPVELLPMLREMPKVSRVVDDGAKEDSSGKSRFNLLQKVPKKQKQTAITVELDMDSYNIPVLL